MEDNIKKRKSATIEDNSDELIGPLPTEAVKHKKKKALPYESLFLENLPLSECYERSYMHREIITHINVTKTDFIITASVDGHTKFWKKTDDGIEFVKHFRSHLSPITCITSNYSGKLLCTTAMDQSFKIFDVINFDMINMVKISFVPSCAEWISSLSDATSNIAIADKNSNKIYVYAAESNDIPLKILDRLHKENVVLLKYNITYEVVISIDKSGMLEYWSGAKNDYKFPTKVVLFESKLDTSLYEFAKNKTIVTGLCVTNNGKRFATVSTDRKVRVFNFLTGKIVRVYDESLSMYTDMQNDSPLLPSMEFGRRLAVERDLERSDAFTYTNIMFDHSGHFIFYPTMLGIKLVNIETNKCIKILGKNDNLRHLHLALLQGRARYSKAALTIEQEASNNPKLKNMGSDPTLFCTAYKKQRFYLYTKRLPSDLQDIDRDIFNEKPSKEDIIALPEGQPPKVFETAIMHTTMGDIHIKLFAKECPQTIENFCVHSKNGYYNGQIFHRVIKGFMIQTGDPTGTGTGGESIWGVDFKDEFHPQLKHDRPYTVSMANAGPNTNGSQFFITVLPTPWLDNKHTVFGRVSRGMEIVQNISSVRTNPKTDKPHEDVKITSIYLSN